MWTAKHNFLKCLKELEKTDNETRLTKKITKAAVFLSLRTFSAHSNPDNCEPATLTETGNFKRVRI